MATRLVHGLAHFSQGPRLALGAKALRARHRRCSAALVAGIAVDEARKFLGSKDQKMRDDSGWNDAWGASRRRPSPVHWISPYNGCCNGGKSHMVNPPVECGRALGDRWVTEYPSAEWGKLHT